MTYTWQDIFDKNDLHIPADNTDFTDYSAYRIQRMRRLGGYNDEDPSAELHAYISGMEFPAFGQRLRKYIYDRAGLARLVFEDGSSPQNADEVPDDTYQTIIHDSFRYYDAPFSFTGSTTKPEKKIKQWLSQDRVSRSTVFLLGFGLHMSADDVSLFLTNYIKEQDFQAYHPEEAVYLYCFQNGYGAKHAMKLLSLYEQIDAAAESFDDDGTIAIREQVRQAPDDAVFLLELARIKRFRNEHKSCSGAGPALPSRSAALQFRELYRKALDILLEDQQDFSSQSVNPSSLAKTMYSGVPLKNNMNFLGEKEAESGLFRNIRYPRLDRNRLGLLDSGRASVNRGDILMLNFYIHSLHGHAFDKSGEARKERFLRFIADTNERLLACSMYRLTLSDPFDAMLVLAMTTADPLGVLNDILAYAYDHRERLFPRKEVP